MSNKKRIAKKRDKLRKRVKPQLLKTFCDFGKGVSFTIYGWIDKNGNHHFDEYYN